MISKREHDAALRRFALIFSGVFMMAAAFYVATGIGRGGMVLAFASALCLGYGLGD